MFVQFDRALPTSLYKERMSQTTEEAIKIENAMMEETDAAKIKLLFRDFVGAHRAMIQAEFAWFEALKRDMEPKPEPKKPFYTRFLKK